MKKKEILAIVEFLMEGAILYAFFSISNIEFMDFYRYGFIYVALYFITERYKDESTLIWQDAHKVLTFYVSFFCISLVMLPLKYITLDILLSNVFITLGTFLMVMIAKRTLHVCMFKKHSFNTLVIGCGEEANKFIHTCWKNRYALSNVKAVINCNDIPELNGFYQENAIEGVNIYPLTEIDNVIRDNKIDIAVLCISEADAQQTAYIRNLLRNKVNEIKFLPKVNSLVTYDCTVQDFDGQLLICSKYERLAVLDVFVKRFIDICAGLIGCLLLLPLSLIVKLLFLKEGDKDSIWFVQERVGKDGRRILIYKYRSMIVGAEKVLQDLMEKDPKIAEEYRLNKKLENDPRVTKIGKFIRESSLDELPQLINVLFGSMSLVGPRPYLPGEIKDMGDYYDSIVSCRPGITGMWQVSGRSDISFKERLKFDEYYANNWSIWLDLTVLIKTVRAVLGHEGAQ